MRRWEKGQRLTLGASWGSHGEESGSVTLLALLADMDSCLQARTPHCTSISTEATFLSIVHGVYSAIWRALVPNCTVLGVHSGLPAQLVGRGHCAHSKYTCILVVPSTVPSWLEEATSRGEQEETARVALSSSPPSSSFSLLLS